MRYLDSAFCLDKPAAQHCLHLSVCQLAVGCLDLSLDRLLQEEAAQAPVEELSGCLPLQDVLTEEKRTKQLVNFRHVDMKCHEPRRQHLRDI